jgi:hypothetical protein
MIAFEKPYLINISSDTKIWRFLDFEKFESLIKSEALFFCRADKFEDQFEGSIPIKEAQHRISFYKDTMPENEQFALSQIKGIQELHKKLKSAIVVNCWHINNFESDAMWKLYQREISGIAIESTVGKLWDSLSKSQEKISQSKIRYLDYEKDIWHHKTEYPFTKYNMITPFVHKRVEFEHEKEYRVFEQISEAITDENYWDKMENINGKFHNVDVEILIESIYWHPLVDEYTKIKTMNLCKKYKKHFKFIESNLSKPPIY